MFVACGAARLRCFSSLCFAALQVGLRYGLRLRYLADVSAWAIRYVARMLVRLATPADFPALRSMLLDMGFVEDEAALERRFPDFCQHPAFALLVAQRDGGRDAGPPVGYALVQDYGPHLRSGDSHRTAKLHDLYTLPAHRQQGVARALMRAVEDWARARPLRYVFWYANIREAGQAYQRMGYQAADAGQEGFLFFELDLGDPATRTPHPTRGS